MALTISDTDKQVLNFDENFASATRTLFSQNGLDAIFSVPGEGVQAPEVSGEVLFETGESQEKTFVPGYVTADPNTDGVVDDYYSGTLTITLRTDRLQNPQSPSITPNILTRHNEICATVRAVLQAVRRPYDSLGASFTFYAVKYIRPMGTRHFTDFEFGQDVTTMMFRVEWAIVPSVWSP